MSGNCALLVIDVQEQFRHLAAPILQELNLTIDHCRFHNIPVIFTQHGHENLDLDGGVLAEHWGRDKAVMVGSPGWALISELERRSSDAVISSKRRYDAFHGTNLADVLRRLKVETVAIAGLVSNLSCESTARSAFSQDFRVVFLSDATAALSPEQQEATLAVIDFGFGSVLCAKDFRLNIK